MQPTAASDRKQVIYLEFPVGILQEIYNKEHTKLWYFFRQVLLNAASSLISDATL
jgi:hypothetical protein